jgi:Spy/CpxP family protein refolding chaperone
MKKHAIHLLTLGLALSLLTFPVFAQQTSSTDQASQGQGRHHGMPSVDERVQHMTKALNLSSDQQTKVRSILQDQQSQMMSLKQASSMSQQDKHAKFEQIHQNTHQKIRDVLNDDQKAKFDQMAERHEMGKHGHGDSGTSDKQQ